MYDGIFEGEREGRGVGRKDIVGKELAVGTEDIDGT